MPITINHGKSDTLADFTGTITQFNSSGGTQSVAATNLVRPSDWNSSHIYTLMVDQSELSQREINFFEPFILHNTNSTLSAPGNGTWYIDPFLLPFQLAGGQINMFMTGAGFLMNTTLSAASTGSMSKVQGFTNALAIYKRGAGANSTRLESVWSNYIEMEATQSFTLGTTTTASLSITNALTVSFLTAVDSTGGSTYQTTSQSGTRSTTASTAASSFGDSLVSGAGAYLTGARMDVIPLNTTLLPGQYWLAHMVISTSASSGTRYTGAVLFSTQSRVGLLENNLGAYKGIGFSASNTSTNAVPFHGFLNTTSSGATSAMANGDIRYTTGHAYWNYDGEAYP